MKWLAVTQRVVVAETGERRDALDQGWSQFLSQAGYLPLLLPNRRSLTEQMLAQLPIQGILLTGGNHLLCCGGDAPERDELEYWLLELSAARGIPLLGVCRGMQLIQVAEGINLVAVSGHVQPQQTVFVGQEQRQVNSYHHWGSFDTTPELQVWAHASDGLVKAIRHRIKPWWGIMWHPERLQPFQSADLFLFQRVFS